ncbi:hypothetical protein FB565_000110 [Actinoplanes lutulentus]|uniref:Uncharacterized protein n=1 Tax=Actinoplanes lutulentus TaxID=1287878 RepID=A0A327Z193_9ACTN|nr:hypothetical protein [Actinoplanes lutulentus]MBB2940406.1 hypothetical protein [Actinoplanes lutulentus]RAK25861.1 hypothetical protein B0I29_13070 [Actinoplanes lutulentus]
MRFPKAVLGVLIADAVVAVGGALFAAPWLLGLGGVVVFVMLALHPVLTHRVMPVAVRVLIRLGLLGLALAVLVQAHNLAVFQSATASATVSEILAMNSDAARMRDQAIRALAGTSLLMLACGGFGTALAILWPPARRAAVWGFCVLAVSALLHAAGAVAAWRAVPAPMPATVLPDDAGTAVVSTIVGIDPVSAALIGILLLGAFLAVDGHAPRS